MQKHSDHGGVETGERVEDAPEQLPVNVVGSASQRRALAISALISALALVWLSQPVASGLFLGTLLAFSLLRTYDRLSRRWRRPELAALSLSLTSAFVIVGGLIVFFYFVVERGAVAANGVVHAFDPGGPLRNVVTRLQVATHASPIGPIDLAAKLRDGAAATAAGLTSWA